MTIERIGKYLSYAFLIAWKRQSVNVNELRRQKLVMWQNTDRKEENDINKKFIKRVQIYSELS